MICNKCFHKDMCWVTQSGYKPVDENKCEHFKDSSYILMLPCKFGEQLYSIRTAVNSKKYRIGKATTLNHRNIGYVIANFGKTMFTKEDAQRKLERLNNV